MHICGVIWLKSITMPVFFATVDWTKAQSWASVCVANKWMSWAGTSQAAQMVKNPPANIGDAGLIPGSGRSPGEWNGNQLKYSCLENPMDRGAWQDTVHGITRVRHDLVLFLCIYTLLRTLTDNNPVETGVKFWLDFSSPAFQLHSYNSLPKEFTTLKLSKLIVAKCYSVNSNNAALFSSLPLMLHNIQFPWWLKW